MDAAPSPARRAGGETGRDAGRALLEGPRAAGIATGLGAGRPQGGPFTTWARTLVGGIWLFYLADPLQVVLALDGWRRVTGVALLVAFAVVYLTALRLTGPIRQPARRREELWQRTTCLALLLVLVLALVPLAGDTGLTGIVFVAALTMGTLPARAAWLCCGLLFAATEGVLRLVPGWEDHGIGLGVVLASLAVWGFRVAATRGQELVQAERELADLSLQEERSRIARDLHDILGHSLTVVTVKAELAQRLLDVDPERARAELVDLERLSRDALADVRQTALGVRGVSLPGEIASARSALESAGIAADLPTVTDEVPSRYRELFAWAVREGVTNVVRHSGARTCRVSAGADVLEVVDDGRGTDAHAPDGRGLDGLRERARLAGATVTTGPTVDGSGFRVAVRVPR